MIQRLGQYYMDAGGAGKLVTRPRAMRPSTSLPISSPNQTDPSEATATATTSELAPMGKRIMCPDMSAHDPADAVRDPQGLVRSDHDLRGEAAGGEGVRSLPPRGG